MTTPLMPNASEPSFKLPITAIGCFFFGALVTLRAVLLTTAGVFIRSKLKERSGNCRCHESIEACVCVL